MKEDLPLEVMDNPLLELGKPTVASCTTQVTMMVITTEWHGSVLEVQSLINCNGSTLHILVLALLESLLTNKLSTRPRNLLTLLSALLGILLLVIIQIGLDVPVNALRLQNVNSSFTTLTTVNVFKNLQSRETAALVTEWKANTTCSTGTKRL